MGMQQEEKVSIERRHLDVTKVVIAGNRVVDPGERRPAITLHGKETTFDKVENERGVSMDVDGA